MAKGHENGCLLLQKRRKKQKKTKISVVSVVSEFFCNKVNKEFKAIVYAQRLLSEKEYGNIMPREMKNSHRGTEGKEEKLLLLCSSV